MDEIIKKMPHSLEAEQSVLGAMLIDEECLGEVFSLLTPECFYLTQHREIFEAMLEMFENSRTIDPITLIGRMKSGGSYDDQAAREYILNLSRSVPSSKNVSKYAEIVKDKYILRRLIDETSEISELCYEGAEETDTILDAAEQKIYNIADARDTGDMQKLSMALIETMERINKIANTENKEELMGVQSGLSTVDSIVGGFNKSDLVILAARPGIGKTSFSLNVARNIALKTQKSVVFFSLEMSKEQLAERLLASEAKLDSRKLREGNLTEADWQKIAEASSILSRCPIYLDDKSSITVAEMKAKLRRIKNLGFVIIDYLQLMNSSRPIDNRVLEISGITRSLKIMAKDLNVPVMLLSQLSRSSEQRREPRPILSDLRDSGSIEQDADSVIFLYQKKDEAGVPLEPNTCECVIAKNRHGAVGDIKLQFIKEFTRFGVIEERNYDQPPY